MRSLAVASAITLVLSSSAARAQTVAVAQAATVASTGPTEPEPYWNGRRTLGAVIGGVGAVGMIIGAAFGAERAGDSSSAAAALASARAASPSVPANSVCVSPPSAGVTGCTNLSNALSSNAGNAQVEQSLLIGGGLLLAIGVITTFWPVNPEPPPGLAHPDVAERLLPRLAPLAGPHVAGLQLSGSF